MGAYPVALALLAPSVVTANRLVAAHHRCFAVTHGGVLQKIIGRFRCSTHQSGCNSVGSRNRCGGWRCVRWLGRNTLQPVGGWVGSMGRCGVSGWRLAARRLKTQGCSTEELIVAHIIFDPCPRSRQI